MSKIKDISGVEHEVTCIACAIRDGKISLPVERISETNHFVVEQDLEYPIEGFFIVASKRHIKSITELTDEEQADLISILVRCRRAMEEKLGIKEVTLIQEETSSSSHFHIWLFPWLSWMHGKKNISSVREIMEYAKLSITDLSKVRQASAMLKEYFVK